MKKIFAIILYIYIIILSGCDVYVNERPKYVTNEKWVCQEVNMYFVGWDEEKQKSYGEYILNDKRVEFFVLFDFAKGIVFYPYVENSKVRNSKDRLLWDQCEFGEDKLVVNIDEEYRKFLGEDIDKITFLREIIE